MLKNTELFSATNVLGIDICNGYDAGLKK